MTPSQYYIDKLANAREYFDSYRIMQQTVLRRIWLVHEIAKLTGERRFERDFTELTDPEKAVVFRSSPIAYRIEYVHNRLRDGEEHSLVWKYLDELDRIFSYVLAVKTSAALSPEQFLRSAGFDMRAQFTNPFPWNICGLSAYGASGSGAWDEATDVAWLFDEVLASIPGCGYYAIAEIGDRHARDFLQALDILGRLAPPILRDIIIHVRHLSLIGIRQDVTERTGLRVPTSLTNKEIASTCFFSDEAFTSLPLLIELMYHESLHIKYLNTITTSFIFHEPYTGEIGAKFVCPWQPSNPPHNSNEWCFDRVYGALHVYIHLFTLYYHLLTRIREYPDFEDWSLERLRVSYTKAGILSRWLDEHMPQVATPLGEQFYADLMGTYREAVGFAREHPLIRNKLFESL